jgi:hypothetical protein
MRLDQVNYNEFFKKIGMIIFKQIINSGGLDDLQVNLAIQ